jgi:RecB family endonuclease NucS
LNPSSIYVLKNPTLEESFEAISEAIEKKEVLIIIGNCWAEYTGRASSKLESGERLLIVKRDGAFLIHRPEGYQPVNWMSGKEVVYHLDLIEKRGEIEKNNVKQSENGFFFRRSLEKVLQIQAIQRTPKEQIKVFFNQINLISKSSLEDSGVFSLYASEEDMKKAVLIKPSLIEKDFEIVSYEKKTDAGFVDVYGIDNLGRFVIVELKRRIAGRSAMLQLAKYRKSIETEVNREIRCVLAAPGITKGTQRLLSTLDLEFKRLDPKKCAEIIQKRKKQKSRISDFL